MILIGYAGLLNGLVGPLSTPETIFLGKPQRPDRPCLPSSSTYSCVQIASITESLVVTLVGDPLATCSNVDVHIFLCLVVELEEEEMMVMYVEIS
ncbi:hypothetical protein FCV25MIE_26537 [Fagus crenata]